MLPVVTWQAIQRRALGAHHHLSTAASCEASLDNARSVLRVSGKDIFDFLQVCRTICHSFSRHCSYGQANTHYAAINIRG